MKGDHHGKTKKSYKEKSYKNYKSKKNYKEIDLFFIGVVKLIFLNLTPRPQPKG
jgi:hypothetical protein